MINYTGTIKFKRFSFTVLFCTETDLYMSTFKRIRILTSGASPTIHLQSGLKASGPLHSLSRTTDFKEGTLCKSCSNKTWKWSQSSGSCRCLLLADYKYFWNTLISVGHFYLPGIFPSSYAGFATGSKPPASRRPLFSLK